MLGRALTRKIRLLCEAWREGGKGQRRRETSRRLRQIQNPRAQGWAGRGIHDGLEANGVMRTHGVGHPPLNTTTHQNKTVTGEASSDKKELVHNGLGPATALSLSSREKQNKTNQQKTTKQKKRTTKNPPCKINHNPFPKMSVATDTFDLQRKLFEVG